MTKQQTEALPDGMVPWNGGDSAPADWDGGPVYVETGIRNKREMLDAKHIFAQHWQCKPQFKPVIAYTPKRAAITPSTDTLERREGIARAREIVDRRSAEAREHLARDFGLLSLPCDEMLAIEYALALTPSPRVDEGRARYRHKKRGTEYTLIGVGHVQGELHDEDPVVIYRGDDGSLWVRHQVEFCDGRFEQINTATNPPADPRVEKLEADLVEVVKRLSALSTAAYEYAGNYLLDERDSPELCRGYPNQHERIVALFEQIEEADATLAKLDRSA